MDVVLDRSDGGGVGAGAGVGAFPADGLLDGSLKRRFKCGQKILSNSAKSGTWLYSKHL